MRKKIKTSSEASLENLEKEALLIRILEQENKIQSQESQIQSQDSQIQSQDSQIQSQDSQIQSQEKKILELELSIAQLKEYLAQERQHRFGRKSEKCSDDGDYNLPGVGQVFDEAGPQKEKQKPSGGRKPLPKELPRQEVLHDLPQDEKICSCGHPLHCIGKEASEQLEIIPAQLKVIRNVRLKYGCKACEETVVLASMPDQPIPKSMAAPGLLSHILVSKFDDHLPLYRQAEILERTGIDLDRGTLGRWVMACGKLLSPLVDLMQQDILASNYIQADETSVQVLNEKNRKATTKSFMWVYKTGGGDEFKVAYQYSPSRSTEVASGFLKGFEGHLQSDGYQAYNKVCEDSNGDMTHLCCWAHARRKFAAIVKISSKKGVAFRVIEILKELYEIEARAKKQNLTFNEIKALRQKESKPLLINLKAFLEEHQPHVPPKSTLGNAIAYTLNYWDKLLVYLEHGHLAIDNNGAERCIRPFAIGRKNWLFKGCVEGAEASAVIFSLLETAKSYGLNPYEYFRDILKKVPREKNLEKLLPYNWKPPKPKPHINLLASN